MRRCRSEAASQPAFSPRAGRCLPKTSREGGSLGGAAEDFPSRVPHGMDAPPRRHVAPHVRVVAIASAGAQSHWREAEPISRPLRLLRAMGASWADAPVLGWSWGWSLVGDGDKSRVLASAWFLSLESQCFFPWVMVAPRPTLISPFKVCRVEQPGGVPREVIASTAKAQDKCLLPFYSHFSQEKALEQPLIDPEVGTPSPRKMFEPSKPGALPA